MSSIPGAFSSRFLGGLSLSLLVRTVSAERGPRRGPTPRQAHPRRRSSVPRSLRPPRPLEPDEGDDDGDASSDPEHNRGPEGADEAHERNRDAATVTARHHSASVSEPAPAITKAAAAARACSAESGSQPLTRPGRRGRTWSRTFSNMRSSASRSRSSRWCTRCSWMPRRCTTRAAWSASSPFGVMRTRMTRGHPRGARGARAPPPPSGRSRV